MKRVEPDAAGRGTRHPIAVVSARTGLSADVLRVWERRYDAVTPMRARDGQRYYTDADVERLKLLRLATEAGRSIGKVAGLPTRALAKMVAGDESAREAAGPGPGDARADGIVAASLEHVRAMDAAALEAGLRRAVALLGVAGFLEAVASLQQQVGREWHAGRLTAAQEHMATAVVQHVVISAMKELSHGNGAPRIVVATPAEERHAIGAALAGAAAAAEGWNVIYLGADLPAGDIAASAVAANARVVALSIVYVSDRAALLRELRSLRETLPATVAVMAGGSGAAAMRRDIESAGVTVVPSLQQLASELRAMGGATPRRRSAGPPQ